MIKVSVIVPVYNVEKYLRECLESLERQTQDNIEVILVNDGSTDCSEEIAKEFAERNHNFHLINRSNGGLSAARNTGLDLAQGEYIYFLDSDDFLADNAIEKLYKKSKEEDLDQLRFVAYTFEDGTKNFKWTKDELVEGYKYSGDYPSVMKGTEFYRRIITYNDYYPSCCLIFTRRNVIQKNNLKFLEGILHEDNLFNFQLTSLCDRVALLHEPLYYRRFRTGSITMGDNWIERNKAMCISAEEADRFIDIHQDIKDVYGSWQIDFFIKTMFQQWEKMTRDDQESKESNEYFKRVKPLIKKYDIGGTSIKLFYVSHSVYRIYRRYKTSTAYKMLCRNK